MQGKPEGGKERGQDHEVELVQVIRKDLVLGENRLQVQSKLARDEGQEGCYTECSEDTDVL